MVIVGNLKQMLFSLFRPAYCKSPWVLALGWLKLKLKGCNGSIVRENQILKAWPPAFFYVPGSDGSSKDYPTAALMKFCSTIFIVRGFISFRLASMGLGQETDIFLPIYLLARTCKKRTQLSCCFADKHLLTLFTAII